MDTEMEFEAFSNLTEIQSFFYGQSVFLTGVTGLVGKVCLEKILRCCPGIGMFYIHMRPKKGLTPQQRMDKLFKLELFRELKKAFPLFHKKVRVVEGDLVKHRLGISFEDFEMIRQNVSIVIHSAASVNFSDPIKNSVEHNVIPVDRMLDLCKEMPHIKAVVHLSTAYVKRERDGSVLEKVPDCKVHPNKLIEALEWMDDKTQKAVEEFLVKQEEKGKEITTYLVTKAMAEILIQEKRGDIPVALVRPCYISPTWKDPFPGWIDTVQGLSGLLLAGAKGALRTLQSVKHLKIFVIPVDVVANTVITGAWHVGTTKPAPLYIMNCCFEYEKLPDADQKILDYVLKKRDEYPLVNMFRYPHFTVYYNEWAYRIHSLIDQWIPALIIDFFLYIFTGKIILLRVYSKISFLYGIFYRLGKDPWLCKVDNFLALRDKLSEEDAKIFYLELDSFDWPEYMDNCLIGGRKYLAHEDPSNIPYARKKAKIWLIVTTILKWIIILSVLYYLFNRSVFTPLYKNVEEKIHSVYS